MIFLHGKYFTSSFGRVIENQQTQQSWYVCCWFCVIESFIETDAFKIIAVWSLVREVNHSVKKTGVKHGPYLKTKTGNVVLCISLWISV